MAITTAIHVRNLHPHRQDAMIVAPLHLMVNVTALHIALREPIAMIVEGQPQLNQNQVGAKLGAILDTAPLQRVLYLFALHVPFVSPQLQHQRLQACRPQCQHPRFHPQRPLTWPTRHALDRKLFLVLRVILHVTLVSMCVQWTTAAVYLACCSYLLCWVFWQCLLCAC